MAEKEKDDYEYGIWNIRHEEIHKYGFTEEEALDWMTEWYEMGGLKEVFYICRRPLSGWELW